MELARMFRFNRTFAPTTPDLQPHHQERLISIMASIQVDSPTISLMQENFLTNLYLLDLHLQFEMQKGTSGRDASITRSSLMRRLGILK
ncbi:hypothetical protein L3X38_045243 [Prunus dulcis]|uniref:Uncharacterized protein n=1 Tax=Prunus dulcis TaxID=3755 RepID=A0AAD4V2A4_PRUDU|nr:hypothetical protein L3X38_045243 [Prunus dulcis]